MKYRSNRNNGFGRSMKHAMRNVLADGYGDKAYETQRTHAARLNLFVDFLKAMGVKDIRLIERQHILAYAEYLLELLDESGICISTAQNRLSSVNVFMGFLTKGRFPRESPSKLLGRRSNVRTTEPSGLYLEEFEAALQRLVRDGEWRIAVLVALCRYVGARFREASLLDLQAARKHAAETGNVVIVRGSKGGRAKKIPRVLSLPEPLNELLAEAPRCVTGSCLVPENQRYIRWYGWAHRKWASMAAQLGMNSKYHDLRAGYACGRFEYLTGRKAPCAKDLGAAHSMLPEDELLSEADAKSLIAVELGHSRTDVLKSYCGRFV